MTQHQRSLSQSKENTRYVDVRIVDVILSQVNIPYTAIVVVVINTCMVSIKKILADMVYTVRNAETFRDD